MVRGTLTTFLLTYLLTLSTSFVTTYFLLVDLVMTALCGTLLVMVGFLFLELTSLYPSKGLEPLVVKTFIRFGA